MPTSHTLEECGRREHSFQVGLSFEIILKEATIGKDLGGVPLDK